MSMALPNEPTPRSSESTALTVVVRGVGDVGSAVAHRLFVEGYAVVIHAGPTPTTTRRGMAFADAVFDGVGPSLLAGHHADVVVETSWDRLGAIITDGSSLPLSGEPREIGGHARDRYVYAPVAGVFRTKAGVGDLVREGQAIAEISRTALRAPLDGILRGLTRDGVPVSVRTTVIEVDPQGIAAEVRTIGERPRRIADGVLEALRAWEGGR